MARPRENDGNLDYLAARLHGRRGRLAEAERLDALCILRSLPDLVGAVYPGETIPSVSDFQSRLVADLAGELFSLSDHLTGPQVRLIAWMLARFQLENLKVLVRGFTTSAPLEEVQSQLIRLPPGLEPHPLAPASTATLEDIIGSLPEGTLRVSLKDAAVLYRGQPKPFYYEAALDRGYFRELLELLDGLSGEDRAGIAAMVRQEVDIFHLMLVMRGKFRYGLELGSLRPFHSDGTEITRQRFARMLAAPDAAAAAALAAGRVLDADPAYIKGTGEIASIPVPSIWEALAWKRFLLLANRAFRRSSMGFGTIAGYAGIRRMEVSNLITLSEGIRLGLAGEAIRLRLIPPADRELSYV